MIKLLKRFALKYPFLTLLGVVIVVSASVLWVTAKGGTGGFNGSTFSMTSPLAVVREELSQATTTPCTIIPPTGTTTLDSFVINFTTSTSSAAVLSVGTSTSQFGTSTSIATITLPAGSKGTYSYVPSNNLGIIGNGVFLTVGAQGVAAGGFSWSGSCSGRFTTN